MPSSPEISISTHDDCPPQEAAIVDAGLDAHNNAAAPLHEVTPLSCFARLPSGEVIGGALGRTWGRCCELQQLWVAERHRDQGIASRLLRQFEERARTRGCDTYYLTTLSFQAPGFYRKHGYATAAEISGYPLGITKHLMVKETGVAPRGDGG